MQVTLFEIPFNIFLPNSTFFLLSPGLGLIGHPLVFYGCRLSQRDRISFVQKYLCYLEYFQEGNDLLGCPLGFSD